MKKKKEMKSYLLHYNSPHFQQFQLHFRTAYHRSCINRIDARSTIQLGRPEQIPVLRSRFDYDSLVVECVQYLNKIIIKINIYIQLFAEIIKIQNTMI